jgi:hypothetical protein
MKENLQSIREDFASRFLAEAIRFLKLQKPSKRNTSAMISAGVSASFLSDKSLLRELEQIWNDTPKKDRREKKNFEEIVLNVYWLKDCKILSPEEFAEYLQKLAPECLKICSDNSLSLESVLQTTKSPLDIEEIACTYAVLGNYEKAKEIANRPELEKFRQDGIRWTIEVEKLRQGDFSNPDMSVFGLHDWGTDLYNASTASLCALGRLPYMGYPYPDW